MPLKFKLFLSVQRPMHNEEKEDLLIDKAAAARPSFIMLGTFPSWLWALAVADVTS